MNWRKGGMAMNKLWSLPYFRFLWEANKVLVLFLVFAYTALIGLPFAAPSTLTFTGYNPYEKVPFAGGLHNGSILALILCFALPVITFRLVHRRTAVDTFFALPVSRKQMLFTTIVFDWLTAFGLFGVISTVLYILTGSFLNVSLTLFLQVLAVSAIGVLALLCVNGGLFLLGNHFFDGLVILAGWTLVPVTARMVVSNFIRNLWAGASDFAWSYGEGRVRFFSAYQMMNAKISGILNEMVNAEYTPVKWYFPVIFAHLCIGIALLIKHFVNRKAERAEQLSSGAFAYPGLVRTYLFLYLIMICSYTVSGSYGSQLLYFVLVLLIYVTATFIYQRRIRISWRSFAIFCLIFAASYGFCLSAWNTRFFGMGDRSPAFDSNYTVYSYTQVVTEADLTGEEDDDAKYNQAAEIAIRLSVPKGQESEYAEQIALFDRFRERCVNQFYHEETAESEITNSMNVFGSAEKEESYSEDGWRYAYYTDLSFDLDELKLLEEKAEVTVYDWYTYDFYTLEDLENGVLLNNLIQAGMMD